MIVSFRSAFSIFASYRQVSGLLSKTKYRPNEMRNSSTLRCGLFFFDDTVAHTHAYKHSLRDESCVNLVEILNIDNGLTSFIYLYLLPANLPDVVRVHRLGRVPYTKGQIHACAQALSQKRTAQENFFPLLSASVASRLDPLQRVMCRCRVEEYDFDDGDDDDDEEENSIGKTRKMRQPIKADQKRCAEYGYALVYRDVKRRHTGPRCVRRTCTFYMHIVIQKSHCYIYGWNAGARVYVCEYKPILIFQKLNEKVVQKYLNCNVAVRPMAKYIRLFATNSRLALLYDRIVCMLVSVIISSIADTFLHYNSSSIPLGRIVQERQLATRERDRAETHPPRLYIFSFLFTREHISHSRYTCYM
uniref:Uncharacterized protein n=1 Tax=Trichogramma kaykai TaxID=54128 RepID=A0ABD2W8G8_9HYME